MGLPAERTSNIYNATAILAATAFFTGITTSIAAPVTKIASDMNGALAARFIANQLPAFTLVLTTGAVSAAWSLVLPIVVTGTYGGVAVSESFQPTVTNGAETLNGSQPFDPGSISVAIPIELVASTLQVGTRDLCAPKGKYIHGFTARAAGNVVVKTAAGWTETIAMLSGGHEDMVIDRILAATAVAVTAYFP